jgi:hypothetical protein
LEVGGMMTAIATAIDRSPNAPRPEAQWPGVYQPGVPSSG